MKYIYVTIIFILLLTFLLVACNVGDGNVTDTDTTGSDTSDTFTENTETESDTKEMTDTDTETENIIEVTPPETDAQPTGEKIEVELCVSVTSVYTDQPDYIRESLFEYSNGMLVKNQDVFNYSGSIDYDTPVTIHYDDNGGITRITDFADVYYSDGLLTQSVNVSYKTIYKYDESGNILSAESRNNSSGQLVSKSTYEYDENGNCILDKYINSSGAVGRESHYQYDENGYMTLHEEYEEGKLVYYYTYINDENGNVLEYSHYERSYTTAEDGTETYIDELYYKYIDTYDSYGKKLTHYTEDHDEEGLGYVNGEPRFSNSEYEYDSKGNIALIKEYDEEKNLLYETRYEYKNEYDIGGRLIREMEYVNGKLSVHNEYYYNENGNLCEAHDYKSDGTIYERVTFKYETYEIYESEIPKLQRAMNELYQFSPFSTPYHAIFGGTTEYAPYDGFISLD